MFRLIALLCAGAFVYNMGHSSAASQTDPSGLQPVAQAQASSQPQPAQPLAPQPLWASVAQSGSVWLARQVHEQTAWAEDPSKATAAAAAEVRAEQPARLPAAPAPVQAAGVDSIGQLLQTAQAGAALANSVQVGSEASPRRLKIVFEPDIRATAASYAR